MQQPVSCAIEDEGQDNSDKGKEESLKSLAVGLVKSKSHSLNDPVKAAQPQATPFVSWVVQYGTYLLQQLHFRSTNGLLMDYIQLPERNNFTKSSACVFFIVQCLVYL